MKISLIRIAESNLLAAKLAIRCFFKIMGKNYMVPNALALDVLGKGSKKNKNKKWKFPLLGLDPPPRSGKK